MPAGPLALLVATLEPVFQTVQSSNAPRSFAQPLLRARMDAHAHRVPHAPRPPRAHSPAPMAPAPVESRPDRDRRRNFRPRIMISSSTCSGDNDNMDDLRRAWRHVRRRDDVSQPAHASRTRGDPRPRAKPGLCGELLPHHCAQHPACAIKYEEGAQERTCVSCPHTQLLMLVRPVPTASTRAESPARP